MKAKTFFILFIVLLAALTNAQWTQTNGPYIGKVRYIVPYKNSLYAQSWSGFHKSSDKVSPGT